MYRTSQEILSALVEGKTTRKNATRYIYNYRKQKKYDLAVMWFRAKIEYEEEYGTANGAPRENDRN